MSCHEHIKAVTFAIVLGLVLSSCAGKPTPAATPAPTAVEAGSSTAVPSETPGKTANETRAPGDFALETIIVGAEEHLLPLEFTEIPAEELAVLYPDVVALPVEMRGRRAADGTEYVVLAALDARDITSIPDVKKVLEQAAEGRAGELHMDYITAAGGWNKYGAIAISPGDPAAIAGTICNAFTGQFLVD